MTWSDEFENEERVGEWERMVDDVSSTIQALASDFGENSSHEVTSTADLLTQEVVLIHETAGVLHLPAVPVIDVATDAELVERWNDAAILADDDEDDWIRDRREVRVTFGSVAEAAGKCCDVIDRALCDVAGEVDETGTPSAGSLVALADAAATLCEWSYIYAESALGYYRAFGSMPDVVFGGGWLAGMLDCERAEVLTEALAGVHRLQ